MEVKGQEFRDTSLLLDDRAYVDCTLTRCSLEYHGSGPIRLVNCRIEDCDIAYRGAAALTVEALQLVAKSGPQGLDHVMRLFLPSLNVDWSALAAAPPGSPAKGTRRRK